MSQRSYVTVVYPKTIPVNNGAANCFLLGPIRNAPTWHEDAIDILARMVREDETAIRLRINCPKRKEHMMRTPTVDALPLATHKACGRQREWEFDTQESSALSAGLLFWFPKEGSKEFPEKVYGAITQVEFGYWTARASVDKRLRIAFGTDGDYNGELHTMSYDIERLCPHLLPLHNSLESLCAQSIRWATTG
jgi:hypothetical protein